MSDDEQDDGPIPSLVITVILAEKRRGKQKYRVVVQDKDGPMITSEIYHDQESAEMAAWRLIGAVKDLTGNAGGIGD